VTRPALLHGEDGFTLVELLVAAALAAIGFLGLAATHVSAIRATAVGRNTTVATHLASEQVESLRRLAYDDLASGDAEDLNVYGRYYTRTVTVAGAPTGISKRVQVDVAWSDFFGAHNTTLVTVIAP
jgi:prepilin-type N-terminal cleavage/methylation domain-containing protein